MIEMQGNDVSTIIALGKPVELMRAAPLRPTLCARCRARALALHTAANYSAPRPLPLEELLTREPVAYLKSLKLRRGDKNAALEALHAPLDELLLTRPQLLTLEQCNSLRKLLRARVTSKSLDTVDGLPDYQVDLTRQQLDGVIGPETVTALWQLPRLLDPAAPAKFTQVRLFLRLYSPATRTQLAVHTDASDYTVNVSLTTDNDVEGGKLVLFHSGKAHVCNRQAGEALIHRWSLAHGVTDVVKGERASLILFFFHRRTPM